jgi:hypothetical protein
VLACEKRKKRRKRKTEKRRKKEKDKKEPVDFKRVNPLIKSFFKN